MKPEIEAKFLNINIDEVRETLQTKGADCMQPMRLMRRTVLDYKGQDGQKIEGWVRVRDEGHKITLTYKTTTEKQFGAATEIEVTVSDFDATVAIFAQLQPIQRAYQESKRETWELHGAEVVIDVWPWLEPYIEIEAPTEETVRQVAKELGFDWKDAVFGSVTTAYRAQYPAIGEDKHISSLPEITFEMARPDWFTRA